MNISKIIKFERQISIKKDHDSLFEETIFNPEYSSPVQLVPLHRRAAAREEIVPGRQPRRSAFADKMIVHYFSLSYFFGLLLLSVGVILPLAYMVVKSKKLSLGTRRD